MYTKPQTYFETDVFPELEANFPLPESVILKFAEDEDLKYLKMFLQKRRKDFQAWEYAAMRGRVVIFIDPSSKTIYGASYAEKTGMTAKQTFIKICEPVSDLPWVAFGMIMSAALYSYEAARDVRAVISYDAKLQDQSFSNGFEAHDYLERARNISAITCGHYKMSLHMQDVFDDIQQLAYIKRSISNRCGS